MKHIIFITLIFFLATFTLSSETALATQHTIICTGYTECDSAGECALGDTEFSCNNSSKIASCGTIGGPLDPDNSLVCSDGTLTHYCARPYRICTHPGLVNPKQPCSGPNQTWSNQGNNCAGIGPDTTDSGSFATFTDNDGLITGQAYFRCNDGSWSKITSTCTRSCQPAGQLWYDSANYQANVRCTVHTSLTVGGVTITINDTVGPYTGNARYKCQNGNWLPSAGVQVCNAESCPATTTTWTSSIGSCSGPIAAASHGSSTRVWDDVVQNVGNATFECDAGNWVQEIYKGYVCNNVSIGPAPNILSLAADTPELFTVYSDLSTGNIKVVANPVGTAPRVLISGSPSIDASDCPAKIDDDHIISDNGLLYLLGCEAGTYTIELRNPTDDSLIETYVGNILPHTLTCVTNMGATCTYSVGNSCGSVDNGTIDCNGVCS